MLTDFSVREVMEWLVKLVQGRGSFSNENVMVAANNFGFEVFIRGFDVIKTQFRYTFMDSIDIVGFFGLNDFVGSL